MELDKRIIKGKRPLTCFDIEEGKHYLGKECYFANADAAFSNLDNVSWLRKGILTGIFEESEYPFCSHGVRSLIESRQIVPCEWVKEEKKEPKYRPYTLAEWIEQHEIGEVIHYRCKEGLELRLMYLGTRHRLENNYVMLSLGDASYSLKRLFEDYEIEVNGEWQPFGVLEE